MDARLKFALWLALGVVVLALAVSAVATPSARAARSAPSSEILGRVCVAERSGPRAGHAGWHPTALALVLTSTPDPEKSLADLVELIEQAEESANPMALDLDPSDPAKQKRLVAALWPSVNAAQSLLSPEVERRGHALVPCDDITARYALWRENAALVPAPSQLRQHAWAIAAAAVIRSQDVQRSSARLRARSAEPGSTFALVVGPLTRVDGLSRLGARAKRLIDRARRIGKTPPPMLALLAQASDSGEVPLALGAADFAVIPRLGALARLAEFTQEIERGLDEGDRFIHRPEPIAAAGSASMESE
jgi:hypothetical protein